MTIQVVGGNLEGALATLRVELRLLEVNRHLYFSSKGERLHWKRRRRRTEEIITRHEDVLARIFERSAVSRRKILRTEPAVNPESSRDLTPTARAAPSSTPRAALGRLDGDR